MLKLLIVEDNPAMRGLIKQIAGQLSDQIFECEDGDEALNMFQNHHPGWVIMDVEMKRMDGLEATEQLTDHYPLVKVIIVTKHTDLQTRRAAREAGAYAFLAKDDLLSLRKIIH